MSEIHTKISRLSGCTTVYVDGLKWIIKFTVTFPAKYPVKYQPVGRWNMSEIHNKISGLSGCSTVYVDGSNWIFNLLSHFLTNICSINHPSGWTCQKFTTKYQDWVDAPQCMSMGLTGSSTYCHISWPISAVSTIRPVEHVRNSQQNIRTEWMLHSVCRWV